ncbi:MAG: choline TMA-lyase-activating enzyme [Desulfuromonas sp.]|nr:choline TMA-lyase-activating enzyme [Desulfuromonas sp.]
MAEEREIKGLVFNVQKYSIYDGPGTRTLVFLKGCPLRCRWCSNPESLSPKQQILLLRDKCVACGKCVPVCPLAIHSIEVDAAGEPQHLVDRSLDCTGCGACVQVCPNAALRLAGEEMTVQQVVDIVLEDEPFYWNSGGGMTLSGGEPTMQPEFATAILRAVKEEGIHTAMETCGQADPEVYERLYRYVDLFLYDLKHGDSAKHKELTGVGNERIRDNLSRLLQLGARVVVRMPLIAGINDDLDSLRKTMTFLEVLRKEGGRIEGVEILPYHRYGVGKYEQLGQEYGLADIEGYSDEQLADFETFFAQFDLPVKLIKH